MENERKVIEYHSKQGKKVENLMHYINKETLMKQHRKQTKGKATGIDGVSKEEYDTEIERNIENLIERMKQMSYKPKAVRRTYIPKTNGKMRPLGIPAYEDKLVQGCMADILNEIYECKFLECSYGFRPNRNCHQVIREINQEIMYKGGNYILDCDIIGHKISKKKKKAKFQAITKWLKENRHIGITNLIEGLNKKIVGTYAYYGINGMLGELYKIYYHARYELLNVVNRRSQRKIKYSKYLIILERVPIAKPRIYKDIWCWNV